MKRAGKDEIARKQYRLRKEAEENPIRRLANVFPLIAVENLQ